MPTAGPSRPGLLRRQWILVVAVVVALFGLPLGTLAFIYSGLYDVAAGWRCASAPAAPATSSPA